jgi:hypothetical protein
VSTRLIPGLALAALLALAPQGALARAVPVGTGSGTDGGDTAAVRVFANCTALNKVYRHGVGKPGSRDRVSGRSRPVTTFLKNLAVYNANRKHDRDKDGVACEKR